MANRFQRPRDCWVLDPDLLKIRQLRPYQAHEMAKTGDAIKMLFLRKICVAVQECAGNKVVNSVDLLKKTILSQASFIRGRCNDYPKGVGSSEPKRHPSRTDDDIVSSARRRVAALRSGRGLASLFEGHRNGDFSAITRQDWASALI